MSNSYYICRRLALWGFLFLVVKKKLPFQSVSWVTILAAWRRVHPNQKKNYDHVNITCGMVNRAARQVHHNLKVTERHMVTIPAKTTWKFVNIFSWILCPNQPKPRYHVVKKPTKLTLNNHHRQATKPNYPITNNKQSPVHWLAPAKTFGSSLEEV